MFWSVAGILLGAGFGFWVISSVFYSGLSTWLHRVMVAANGVNGWVPPVWLFRAASLALEIFSILLGIVFGFFLADKLALFEQAELRFNAGRAWGEAVACELGSASGAEKKIWAQRWGWISCPEESDKQPKVNGQTAAAAVVPLVDARQAGVGDPAVVPRGDSVPSEATVDFSAGGTILMVLLLVLVVLLVFWYFLAWWRASRVNQPHQLIGEAYNSWLPVCEIRLKVPRELRRFENYLAMAFELWEKNVGPVGDSNSSNTWIDCEQFLWLCSVDYLCGGGLRGAAVAWLLADFNASGSWNPSGMVLGVRNQLGAGPAGVFPPFGFPVWPGPVGFVDTPGLGRLLGRQASVGNNVSGDVIKKWLVVTEWIRIHKNDNFPIYLAGKI